MATLARAIAIAAGLPGVTEGTSYGHRGWSVGTHRFAWERPFSKADVRRFGGAPVPEGPILAVATGDLAVKEAVLASGHDGVLTIEHLAGYPAVLIALDAVEEQVLTALVVDAWLAAAPAELAEQYLADHPGDALGS